MKTLITAILALGVASSLFAGDANLENGKKLFEAQCKSCHGADGTSKTLGKETKLVGVKADTLAETLKDYKDGKVDKFKMGKIMKVNAAKLSETDIKDVSKYIASLKAPEKK